MPVETIKHGGMKVLRINLNMVPHTLVMPNRFFIHRVCPNQIKLVFGGEIRHYLVDHFNWQFLCKQEIKLMLLLNFNI